jgi:hypothetical protein
LEQFYTTDRVQRKINVSVGDRDFVPRSKITFRAQWKGESASRNEYHELSDFSESAKKHFMVISIPLKEGTTAGVAENLMRLVVSKVMALTQILSSASESRELGMILALPDHNYKVRDGKLHIFLSVNPKIALVGLNRREYKSVGTLYEDIPECPQVKQSIKGTVEASFCPFSFKEDPDASIIRLILRNIRLNAEAKMWKDLRRLLFTFSKLGRARIYDLLPITLLNSLDVEAHFDNVTEIPMEIIKKFLKWLKRKRIAVPSYNQFKQEYSRTAQTIFSKGYPIKMVHDLLFGSLNINQIEVRVYY